jgi:large subunit ribosomal protein L17
MRHRKANYTLGLTQDHRWALLANLACALARAKKIRTTQKNAKAAGRFVDKLVTIAKKGTLAAHRHLIALTRSQDIAKLFMDVIGPAFKDRKGGYTRVIKAMPRPGDGAPTAYLEFTESFEAPSKKTGKKKAKKEKPAKESKKTEEVEEKKTESKEKEEKKSSGFLGSLRGFLKGE